MGVKICHASIDEYGHARSGSAGDQTGKEVCVREWYDKSWDTLLRYPDDKVTKKVVSIAQKLANSNLVGYDQNQRNTLYTQLKKCGWSVDKYIKSGVKTETDCSAFIYACFCCVIPKMRSDSNAPTTSTMANTYMTHGFVRLKDAKTLRGTDNLRAGDVLVASGHHTVLVVSAPASTTPTPTHKARGVATAKSDALVGEYVYTRNARMRHGAGLDAQTLTELPRGTRVTCHGYYTPTSTAKWLYCTASVKGVEYAGFVCDKVIKKRG